MASGHVNRIYRPNTWLHRPMLQNVKKALANSEPSTHGAKRTFTEKLTSEKRQQEILLGCREDALPANGAPGSQLTCADWRAQGLRQRR